MSIALNLQQSESKHDVVHGMNMADFQDTMQQRAGDDDRGREHLTRRMNQVHCSS